MSEYPSFERLGNGAVLLRGAALRRITSLAKEGVKPMFSVNGSAPSPQLRWLLDQMAAEAEFRPEFRAELRDEALAASSNAMSAQRISSKDAAGVLGCSERYVRKIATSLDGRRDGARWTFDRLTVETYHLERGSR